MKLLRDKYGTIVKSESVGNDNLKFTVLVAPGDMRASFVLKDTMRFISDAIVSGIKEDPNLQHG